MTPHRQPCVAVESLESRRLLTAATLRVVSYNIEADVDGNTAPLDGLTTVLQGLVRRRSAALLGRSTCCH